MCVDFIHFPHSPLMPNRLILGLVTVFVSLAASSSAHAADLPFADVSITQTGPATVTRPSQGKTTITFTAIIRNNGPKDAKNVNLIAGPTTGGVYQNKRFSGCTATDQRGTCTVGLIQSNTSKTVTVSYDLLATTGPAAGICKKMNIAHYGLAWSTQTLDLNMLNNNSFAQTVVNCPVAVAPARLDIAVKAIGSTDVAVKNQKNITLLRMEASGSGTDILFATARFIAQQGSALNMASYTFWGDTNSDGVVDRLLDRTVASADNKIFFKNIVTSSTWIKPGQTMVFEVRGDVASNLVNNTLQLAFDSSSPMYIEADTKTEILSGISTNGVCDSASCQIFVHTTPSKTWNFASQGNLYVSKDIESVRSRQLLGGTVGDPVLRVNLRADLEDIDVTLLSIVNGGPSGSISRLDLYRAGETTPFANATQASCGVTVGENVYCAVMVSGQLTIPKNQELDVIIRPKIKSDEEDGRSGENIQLQVIDLIGNPDIAARGAVSMNTIIDNNGNTTAEGEIFIGRNSAGPNTTSIVGANNHVVMSKIISITNVNPDANGTQIPIGNGRTIAQFQFAGAANMNTKNGQNKSVLTNIIFTVNATNMTFDKNSFKVYNKADVSVKAPCVIVDDTGTSPYYVACWDIATSGVNTDVTSGSSTIFALETSITNPNVNPGASSLQVSLDRFNDITLNGVSSSLSHISWQDKDAVTTSNNFFWIESPESVINSTQYVR